MKGFIELSNLPGKKVLVNADFIGTVSIGEGGSVVLTLRRNKKDGTVVTLIVNETYEEVKKLIEEAVK